jgi:exopolysaccharide production protein ExoQ
MGYLVSLLKFINKYMGANVNYQNASTNPPLTFSSSNSRLFSILLGVFLIITLVGFMPFSPRNTLVDLETTGSGSVIRQALYVLIFALSIIFFALSKKRLVIVGLPWPIIMVFAWSLLTLLWSAVPDIGFRRLMLAFIICSVLYNLVFSLGIQKAFKILVFVVVGCTLVSLLAGLLIPAAVHQPNDREFAVIGDWRGIFVHKNNAGLMAALAFMLAFNQLLGTKQKLWAAITGLTGLMLLLTGSKTSLILCFPALTMGYFAKHYLLERNRNVKTILTAALALMTLLIISFVLLNWQLAEDALADPTAFTGRAGIWGVMLKVIGENPLFGHGFGSLFSVGSDTPLAKYTTDYAFEWVLRVAHAHNGYLEMIASIGFIGFVVAFYAFLVKPVKLFCKLPTQYTAPFIVPIISLLFFMIFHNTFETSLFNGARQGWIIWFFIVCFIYCLDQQVKATHKKNFTNEGR